MTTSPTSLADYWTQQDTQAWLDQPAFPRNGNHDQQERWRRTVGNPAMKRLAHKGVIKTGYLDPEASEDPVNLAGSINADLRWTTIVDRQHLVDLLAQDMGAEPAAAAVSELLKQNPDILQVQVEPGTHHLYFAGDSQTFARTAGDRFAVEGLYLEDFEEPVYALTDQPLQPAATMRRSPRP